MEKYEMFARMSDKIYLNTGSINNHPESKLARNINYCLLKQTRHKAKKKKIITIKRGLGSKAGLGKRPTDIKQIHLQLPV